MEKRTLYFTLCIAIFVCVSNGKSIRKPETSDTVRLTFEFVDDNQDHKLRVKRALFEREIEELWGEKLKRFGGFQKTVQTVQNTAQQATDTQSKLGTAVENINEIITKFTTGTEKGMAGFKLMGEGFNVFFKQFEKLRIGKK